MGWVEEEFRELDFGDSRLNERLVVTAQKLYEMPMSSVRRACGDVASAKAAFRLFDNPKAESEQILQAHRNATLKRIELEPADEFILAVQDTSYLSYDHHPSTEGLGPISPGGQQTGVEGLILHSCLAVSQSGVPLGILAQKTWARTKVVGRKKSRSKVAQSKKESFKWIEMSRQVGTLVGNRQIVTIADREADIFGLYEEIIGSKQSFVVRAHHPRKDQKSGINIFKYLKARPILGMIQSEISGRSGLAEFTLKAAEVLIKKGARKARLCGLLVQEKTSRRNKIEWFLFTNLSVNTFEDAVQKVQWYRYRWRIETFHKVLKSGYEIEECRLRHANRLIRYAALMSVLSWRVHWMTLVAREYPQWPCTNVFDDDEWKAIYLRAKRSRHFPTEPPTLRQTIRDLATLGGFTARKSDGEPGITTIWRGLFSLNETLLTLQALQ